MNRLSALVGAGVLILFASPAAVSAAAENGTQVLEERNARLCAFDGHRIGVGKLLSVQFEKKVTKPENLAKIEELIPLFEDAMLKSNQTFIAFNAIRDWDTCRNVSRPSHIYWYDYSRSWRGVGKNPLKSLKKMASKLPAELRGTEREAYLLFAMAQIEGRLGKRRASIDLASQAYQLIDTANDPLGQRLAVLRSLVLHYFQDEGSVPNGQEYLNEYAVALHQSTSGADSEGLLVKVVPIYPRAAQMQGIEGYVVIQMDIDINGRVENAVVVEETPEGVFGDAALLATSQFRYVPKVVDGQRVAAKSVRNRIDFELGR